MDLLSLVAQTVEPARFYETSWFAATMLAVIVLSSWGIGWFISRSVQMNEQLWRLALIAFSVIFSSYYVSMNWPPRFGVDLKGGVTFIVDLNLDNNPEKVVQKYLLNDTSLDGKISQEEFPAAEARTFKRIDKDNDGFATANEIREFAKQQSEEDGQVKETVENVIDQLKKRIDPSGIYEVELRALGSDQIEITIPDADESESNRIFERIKKAGYLQFRIIAKTSQTEHKSVIDAARNQASGTNPDLKVRNEVRSLDRVIGRWVNVGRLDAKRAKQLKRENRPFRFTIPFSQGSLDCLIRNSATGDIVDNIPQSPSNFKGDEAEDKTEKAVRFNGSQKLRAAFYADWWAETQMQDYPNAEMQILVIEPPERENVEGQDLVPSLVRQGIDRTGRPAVEFTLKRAGVPKFSRLTGNNIDSPLGMILDGELLSAPNINSKIYKNGIIEGDFSSKEVQDLISILKAGQLKTTLQSPDGGGDKIDSTMGQEMKDKGFWAIGASFVLILIFLVFYYQIAGIVACLALVLNLLMILAIIMMLKQPLTLNGLAGLVLTVGMSVDANVLIFERIREELSKDATLRMAIRNGFQRATTTIVDANITTFITAFILYVIGNEQLKSFSVALMLGILLSMFTAIFCSRVIFDIFEKKRWLKTLGKNRLFSNTRINFMGKRGIAFVISIAFIAVGIGAIFVRGNSMLNHDLAGGSMARLVFANATDKSDIDAELKKISQANPINGSPAVITSAEVRSTTRYPDKTYYRIMSNWKSQGDTSKSLAILLKEAFGDKLAKSTIQITDVQTTGSATQSATQPDANAGQETAPGKGKPPEDSTNAVAPNPPQKAPDAAPENSKEKSEPPANGSEPCGGNFQQDQPSANAQPQEPKTPNPAAPSVSQAAPAESPQEKTTETSEGEKQDPVDLTSGFDSPEPAAPKAGIFKTKATIQFSLNVDATFKKKFASLKSDFVDAAQSLQFDNYSRNNIRLRDPSGNETFVEFEKSIGEDTGYESDVWEVEITTQGADHGSRILDAMQAQYNGQIFLPQAKEVGERFAQKAWLRAFAAMIASLVGIVAYIWIRFQRVSFGLAAVAALIHDVLVVVGAIAVSFWLKDALGIILVEDFKISLAVIAALLTIIGYSLNDTIVVFDRIREVRGKNSELNGDMVNRSINQTLSRTILTSLTTFIVVVILYGAGGDAIHGFAFALVVGVIVGTYSSIFVASPILLLLMKGDLEVDDELANE
ncbi:MAG: protein translocase subunit SecD [Planctomycetota bacterium]|nr:protein translocase subunit SecD [Planctomycetota bacterium]